MDKERQIYQLQKENNDNLVKAISESKPTFSVQIDGEEIEAVEIEGPKGEPGIDGKNGKDGETPIFGVDYFTEEQVKNIQDYIISSIPKPKDGKDGKDADYDKVIRFVKAEVAKIPKPKDGKNGITPVVDYQSILDKIAEKIPEIDYSLLDKKIEDKFTQIERVRPRQLQSGGPTMHLADINDVNVDGITTGQVLSWNGTNWVPATLSSGSGTVTSASVVSANGFAGTVATATTTPAITLTTTVTGLLKGDGTAISAASAGTDYEVPLTFSTGLTRATNTITANLSTGVAGGQSVIGGTASGENLTLSSTSNATKGAIIFGTSRYDEVNNRLGINITPSVALDIYSASTAIGRIGNTNGSYSMGFDSAGGYFQPFTASKGFYFYNAAGTTYMGVSGTGGVGVNTTAPGSTFSVSGSASFGTYATSAAPSNGLVVSGSVGIGTTTVPQKLTVASGNILLTGEYGLKWTGGSQLIEQTVAVSGVDRMIYLPNGDRIDIITESGSQFMFAIRLSEISLYTNGTVRQYIDSTGKIGFGGVTSPTAWVHLPAGAAAANNAPLKFTAGTALTTPAAGAMEFSNSESGLTFTAVSTRKAIAFRNPIVSTITSSSTPTPTAGEDHFTVTALAAGATFAAPTGTPTDGQILMIRIKDNGTARTLAFNAIYRAIGVTLPTTTVISKTMYLRCVYNSADTKWDVLATATEA